MTRASQCQNDHVHWIPTRFGTCNSILNLPIIAPLDTAGVASEAEASVWPSGEKATAVTQPLWPSSVCSALLTLLVVGLNALDGIQQIRNGLHPDVSMLLGGLDSIFARTFTTHDDCMECRALALDLRTCRLIELLVAQTERKDVESDYVDVFCKDENITDLAKVLTCGPYKNLTLRENSEEDNEAISKRSRCSSRLDTLERMHHQYSTIKVLKNLEKRLLERDAALYQPEQPAGVVTGQQEGANAAWLDAGPNRNLRSICLKPSDRVLNTPEQYAGALRPTITADGRILFWRIDTNLGVERRFTCAYPTHSCEKQYTKLGGGVDFTLSYLSFRRKV
ncbi:hypothetical protein X797_012387 [Metarhizium robertsii]|uniref:Uncharacterized protein n=1 Tax=Metarhizium robertsii TaxID=568076 RepID=A0A014QPH7_9HYPO|nr:hypothetical protein X797_012387 [Metarhizium robertsii]